VPIELRRSVWGGMDPQAGGTWLGVNSKGLVVGIANLGSGKADDPEARSRGLLCIDLLRIENISGLLEALQKSIRENSYNTFNLIVAHALQTWVAT